MKIVNRRFSHTAIGFQVFFLTIFVLAFAGTSQAQQVFHISPSGDLSGETDWVNLIQAFESAKSAGIDNIVELDAGTFYIPRPLQVANFSGTFRGAGKGKTILRTAPGIEFGLLEPPLERMAVFMAFWLDGRDPVSSTFWPENLAQNLTLSGFTIVIDTPAKRWYSHCERTHPGWQTTNFIDIRGRWTGLKYPIWEFHPEDIMETTAANAKFADLELISRDGYGQNGTQVWGEGITFTCPDGLAFEWAYTKWISGTQGFEGISYDSLVPYDAIGLYNLIDSTVVVGGNSSKRVIAHNVGNLLRTWDLSNTSLRVSHVDSTESWGMNISSGIDTAVFGLPEIRLPEPSEYLFEHNRIQQRPNSRNGSLQLVNYAGIFGRELGAVVISNNFIHSEDHVFPFGPIFSYFVDGALVTNNKVTGRGDTAIAIEPFGTIGRDWVILGNNVENYESTPYQEQILLGPGTSNCTVVGGDNKANVFDMGTDNYITGVSNPGYRELPLGQFIGGAVKNSPMTAGAPSESE